MNKFFEKYKENLVSNIALTVALVFSIVHLVILTLSVFDLTPITFYEGFNYFLAYVLLILSLGIFILCFFIEKLAKIKIPTWFSVVFYIAFFLFTNTYYAINGYANLFTIIFFFAYISFISTIANVSVFYNTQKDEKNKLVASRKYIMTSVFFYSVGTNAIFEIIISAIKSFCFPKFDYTSLEMYIVEFCTMLLVTIIMCFILNASLKRKKRVINGCLIKKYK